MKFLKKLFSKIKQLFTKHHDIKCDEEESHFEKWARHELELIEQQPDAADISEKDMLDTARMQNLMTKDLMELIHVFASQGHSGFSAEYARSMLNRLLAWKPIMPLTGAEDEWEDSSFIDATKDSPQHNKRYSAVFRENHDNATAHNIEGKVFTDDGGKNWWTNHNSWVNITFPYYPPEHPEKVYLTEEDVRKQVEAEEAEAEKRVCEAIIKAEEEKQLDDALEKLAEPSEELVKEFKEHEEKVMKDIKGEK
jgi:hypothetical protein